MRIVLFLLNLSTYFVIWHVNGYLKALALSYQKAAMKTEKPKKMQNEFNFKPMAYFLKGTTLNSFDAAIDSS